MFMMDTLEKISEVKSKLEEDKVIVESKFEACNERFD
jgi:hypothetical protein